MSEITTDFEEEYYYRTENSSYDPEYCYECTGYGDDYYEDENGELISACDTCIFSPTYNIDIDYD